MAPGISVSQGSQRCERRVVRRAAAPRGSEEERLGVHLCRPMAVPTAHRDEVLGLLGPEDLTRAARRLTRYGFVHLKRRWPGWVEAKRVSREIIAAAGAWDPIGRDLPELTAVGEFVVPPPGAMRRDYQALHIDFGLPILAEGPVDVARFT